MVEHPDRNPSPPQSLITVTRSPSHAIRKHIHPRAAEHAAEGGPNLKPAYLWWVFRQWWMVIVPASVILAGAASTAIMLTYEPDYRASALIAIEENAPYIVYPGGVDPSGSSARYVQTQVELLRSPVVLELLLARPKIAKFPAVAGSEDQIGHLQRGLNVARIGDSDLFNVAYISKSPEHSREVANAVVAEYLKIQSQSEYDRSLKVIQLLETERQRRRLVVDELKRKVVKLAEDVTGKNPFSQRVTNYQLTREPYEAVFSELYSADATIAELEARLTALQEASPLADTGSEQALDIEVSGDQRVRDFEALIAALEQQFENYKKTLRDPDSSPAAAKYEREIEAQKTAFGELKEKVRTELVTQSERASRAEKEKAVADAKRQLDELNKRRDVLQKQYESELKGIEAGSQKTVELTFTEADLRREEKVLEMIESRKLSLQTESRAPARITVRQQAALPTLPVSKVPTKLLLMACAICMAGPFGLAVLREISIRRITDVEQLSREASVRVVGEVSHFPIRRAAANGQLLPAKLRRQMFVYLESVDSLRTNLALTEPKSGSRVLVVTSAAAAEGKTCLATSLAVSIANAENKPTLVIDGDMRSPDVASVLGTRDRPGLAELLTNQSSLSDVVQRVGKTNTYVIAAGRLKGNPHHAVREERIGPLLAQLRGQFSTIVVDTPPIFGGSESLVFAKMADAVLVSAMRDVSRTKQLSNAVDRLERAGATVAGAVLNGTSSNSYAYNYGYGYYSGRLDAPDG